MLTTTVPTTHYLLPDDADRSDPLTGCLNRAGIEADLNAWWAGVPDHTRLCVAMVDIDRLAEANEQFGYRSGNEILKAIAQPHQATRAARAAGQAFAPPAQSAT